MGFKAGRAVYKQVDKSKKLSVMAQMIEQTSKIPIFRDRDCGDCSLPDIAYLCPESQCAKNQRNGPCGGTGAGKCEVLEQECIWIRAFDRLKPFDNETTMLERPVVFRDASLRHTSTWVNRFLGRDHFVKTNPVDGSSGA